jgi:hypothetical protein
LTTYISFNPDAILRGIENIWKAELKAELKTDNTWLTQAG